MEAREEEATNVRQRTPSINTTPFADTITHFDAHVYFFQNDEFSTKAAAMLREETMNLFPSITVFEMVSEPIGPHPIGMFEAHLTTSQDFSTYVSWLAMNHNSFGEDLSILLHPNSFPRTKENQLLDHSSRAIWIGTPLKLNFNFWRK